MGDPYHPHCAARGCVRPRWHGLSLCWWCAMQRRALALALALAGCSGVQVDAEEQAQRTARAVLVAACRLVPPHPHGWQVLAALACAVLTDPEVPDGHHART